MARLVAAAPPEGARAARVGRRRPRVARRARAARRAAVMSRRARGARLAAAAAAPRDAIVERARRWSSRCWVSWRSDSAERSADPCDWGHRFARALRQYLAGTTGALRAEAHGA